MEFLSSAVDQLATLDNTLVLTILGVGVFIIGFSAPFVFAAGATSSGETGETPAATPAPKPARLRADEPDRWLSGLGAHLEPKAESEFAEARLAMIRAGYRSRFALRLYYLLRVALCLGLGFGVAGALFATTEFTNLAGSTILLFALGAAVFGFVAPMLWVALRRQSRQEQIRDAFPDSLDLMLVCVEAGQGLDQAIARVAREIEIAHPVLAEEYRVLSAEIRAGRNRSEALRGIGLRTDVAEISSLAAVLIQSAESGASVGHALRVFASEMRERRLLRAEEKANRLPVKLALGTMVFTVPPLLIILVAPVLVDLLLALGNASS
ncbi:MAG: type II secretion system F family protein [Pseudomonadota bacterium]